ncbi:ABC transporter permease, partial [Micromonospora sp. PSH25]|nr:ABC transporter permease [Micromonospora foliorum]
MVAARPGADVAALTEKVRAVAGAEATVRSRQQILDEAGEDAVRNVDQFRMRVLIVVGGAIGVAGWVMATPFAAVRAQRTRRAA